MVNNCLDCSKRLSKSKYKRCKSCAQKGSKNHSWKGGLPNCDHCGKQCKFSMSKYCVDCLQLGERNHQWKNGSTPLNRAIRRLKQYKSWRRQIVRRDSNLCQKCWKRSNDIEVHHIIPFYQLLEKFEIKSTDQAKQCIQLWDLLLGQVLCKNCHKLTKGINQWTA